LTSAASPRDGRSRLPDLGPRGEGWVIGQITLIGLLVLAGGPALGHPVPPDPLSWLLVVLGGAAIVLGGWAVGRAFVDLGRSLTPVPRPRADARLVTSGIYSSLRHPIYAGMILAGFGWSALTRSLTAFALALLLAGLLDAKARREEAWLVERYPGYEEYRRRSKRFVPGVY
jgi:protein-S-isoprenylcysteine O-methyltransferase Ste14